MKMAIVGVIGGLALLALDEFLGFNSRAHWSSWTGIARDFGWWTAGVTMGWFASR